jgi:hypothetical protein
MLRESRSMPHGKCTFAAAAILTMLAEGAAQTTPQNPSPMVEHTRTHARLTQVPLPGRREKLRLGTLFLPQKLKLTAHTPLLMFFHAPDWIPELAAVRHGNLAVITIRIGAGTSVYERPFLDPKFFGELLREAERKAGVTFDPITLGGWSAGCGAIRGILTTPVNYERVRKVVLIDGIHTGYVGGKPGPVESKLEIGKLEIFVKLARDAIAGRKSVVITHSEIFPGTFAGTTETADAILRQLGLRRRPVLRWADGDPGIERGAIRAFSADRIRGQLRPGSRGSTALPAGIPEMAALRHVKDGPEPTYA